VGADHSVNESPLFEPLTRLALSRFPAIRTALIERSQAIVNACSKELSPSEQDLVDYANITSFLYAPLVAGDDCLGIMVLLRKKEGGFTRDQARSVADAAGYIGPALANARLLRSSRKLSETQQSLYRVSQAAISLNDQSSVLREIARATIEVMASDSCLIQLWNRDADEMETVANEIVSGRQGATFRETHRPLRSLRGLRFVLNQQTPLQMHPKQVGLTDSERDELLSSGTESLLIVPMIIGGSTLGAITLGSGKPRAFNSDSLNVAQEIAAQTALAIQNARFVEGTRRHVEEQSLMLRVSQAVITSPTLRAAMREIAHAALEFEPVEGCRILLWSEGADHFELAAEENVPDWLTYYQIGDRYPVADWPSARFVIAERKARTYVVSDAEISARERANHVADGVKSFALVPIVIGDECLGCLALHSRLSRRCTTDTVRIGRELATQTALAIDRARLVEKLRERAETDGLTGLLNHRAAFESLDRELAYARAHSTSVGLVVLDLDDFKLFNDTHGHLTGDNVLIDVAKVLRETARPKDKVARFGGDEFLLILPEANDVTARTIAERLMQKMGQTSVAIGKLNLPIRFSIGAATFPGDARNRQELIAYADSAMYRAKELGGGQVGTIARGTRSLEVSTLGALSGLVRAVDRKDRYTKDHSDLVASFAVRCGRMLELGDAKLEALDLAGQLHDVGKIAVPDSILRKPGYLTREEQAMIRQHVVFSELMIKGVPHLDDVLAAVAHHHERWDGGGYPFGKTGVEIPLLGRILALADALAAMTYDCPYRKGRTIMQAVSEIRAGAGTQFDPDLVEPFIRSVTTSTSLLEESQQVSSIPVYRPPRKSAERTSISQLGSEPVELAGANNG